MKKRVFTAASAALAGVAVLGAVPLAIDAAQAQGIARFKFTNGETLDFGSVPQGGVVEKSFQFVNAGDAPLIMTGASADCGCITLQWPRTPILPRASGTIVVRFNAAGRSGAFEQTIQLNSNAQVPAGARGYTLRVKGSVAP